MQNKILMGLKIWRSWKQIGSETNRISRAGCSETNKTSQGSSPLGRFYFFYRNFWYSINLPVYSVSRYIYPFSICLDVVFCSTRGDSNRSKTLIFNMKLTLKNHNYICRYCYKATRFFICRFFSNLPVSSICRYFCRHEK